MLDCERHAFEVMEFLMTKAVNSSNALAKAVELPGCRITDPRPNDDEMGDYVQSFVWLGRHLGAPKYTEWAVKQSVVFMNEHLQKVKNGKPWDITEADRIIGPVIAYILTRDSSLAECIDHYFQILFATAITRQGLIRSKVGKLPWQRFPVADPMTNGNHIELLYLLYLSLMSDRYLSMAEKLVDPWLNDKYFTRFDTFTRRAIGVPGVTASYLKDILFEIGGIRARLNGWPSYCARICKQNTHMMFAILAAARVQYRKECRIIVYRFIKKVRDAFRHPSGLFYLVFDLKRNIPFHLDILPTIALIEMFIDSYKIFEDVMHLQFAVEAAEALLQYRDDTGLILHYPLPKNDSDNVHFLQKQVRQEYNLDPQVDFVVNLIKLYQCTHDRKYKEAAFGISSSIIKRFRLGPAFAEVLHDGKPQPVVRTKYLGLLLKLFISLIAVNMKQNILDDFELALVCQDR